MKWIDPNSLKVSSIKVLNPLENYTLSTELAFKFAQSIKFRKSMQAFRKTINNILPLITTINKRFKRDKTKFENIKQLITTGEKS